MSNDPMAVLAGTSSWSVTKGNSLDVLATLPPNVVHSIVQDPPGGGDYLKKSWDGNEGRDQWIEKMRAIHSQSLRVARPGAYSFTWAFNRNVGWTHRALEAAGWTIMDLYTQDHHNGTCTGSLDVAKALEALLTLGTSSNKVWHKLPGRRSGQRNSYSRISDMGQRQGYRKNSVDHKGAFDLEPTTPEATRWQGWQTRVMSHGEAWILARKPLSEPTIPENLLKHGVGALNIRGCYIAGKYPGNVLPFPKPTLAEKEAGLDGLDLQEFRRRNPGGLENEERWQPVQRKNPHATVKGIELMRWLIRLVSPKGGICLDPFCGSGTTGCAAVLEGVRFIGVELDSDNQRMGEVARARIRYWEAFEEPHEEDIDAHPDQLSIFSLEDVEA